MEPTLTIIAGGACVGKSTLAEGIVKELDSSLIVDKDILFHYNSMILPTQDEILTLPEEYLKNIEGVETEQHPFKNLDRIPWGGEYFGRHVKFQSYQGALEICKHNLELGKSPIYVSIPPKMIRDGTIVRVLEDVSDFPCALIYLNVPEEEIKRRILDRMSRDPIAKERDKSYFDSTNAWQRQVEDEYTLPHELKGIDHLFLDTFENSPLTCVTKSLGYIKSQSE